MLAGLGHGTVRGADDQDRAVHLRGTGDHVLDVVGVTRAVHVCVVTVLRLVLDVGDRDRDTALALFGGLVDLVERREVCPSLLGQRACDRSRKGGLAVVDVTDGTDVHVRLGAFELLLRHISLLLTRLRTGRPVNDRPTPVSLEPLLPKPSDEQTYADVPA